MIVRTTNPFAISSKDGVNVGLSAVFPGKNTPVLPDQVALTAEPPTEPLRTISSPSHITSSTPAETMAEVENKISITSDSGPHVPTGSSDVKVRITLPALNSAAVGVYTAFKSLVFGLNIPAPPDQDPVIIPPVMDPLSWTS